MENNISSSENSRRDKLTVFFQSRQFNLAIKAISVLIIALVIFQFGMYVGFRKAKFSYSWGDNYHRVFGGPQGGILRDFAGRDFMSAHGAAGTVAKIDGNSIIIKGSDGTERIIVITSRTRISAGRAAIGADALRAGDGLTAIGKPNADGTVSAEIIRIFGHAFEPPAPPTRSLPYMIIK